MKHRKTRKTHERYYAQAIIHSIAHEQWYRLLKAGPLHRDWHKYQKAVDRWVYAPDRWHDCPSHKWTKDTPYDHQVDFIITFVKRQPDNWTHEQWNNYLRTLFKRYGDI